MKSTLIYTHILLMIIVATIISQTSQAARLYKWVDKDGNISYQDQPPPNQAKLLQEKDLQQNSGNSSLSANNDKAPVLVYLVENCEQCDHIVRFLQSNNVPHQTVSMIDRDIQQRLLDSTGSLLAPTIQINDQYITDSKEDNLERALNSAGYELTPAEQTTNTQSEYSSETAQ